MPPLEELHLIARAFLPIAIPDHQEVLSKPSRIIIAVERHEKDHWIEKGEPHDRFLWIKGRAKITIQQIRESYVERSEIRDLKILLGFGQTVMDEETTVGQLDLFKDRLVVLTAVQQDANATKPDDNTLTFPANISRTPSRQPLQPVNRQLSVPPKNSYEGSKIDPDPRFNMSDPGNYTPKLEGSDSLWPPRPLTPLAENRDAAALQLPVHRSSYPNEPMGNAARDINLLVNNEYTAHEDDNPFMTQDEDDNPFAKQEEPEIFRGQHIRDLAGATTPERLEAGLKAGTDILSTLKVALENLRGKEDAENWLSQIENVRKDAVRTRTVVGVVGNTGAGKSSVINAMLGEERLVPTNCMRACTAVVTELSYNHSDSEKAKYRAEVEFIQPEEWRKELDILFKEVFDDDGHMVHEARNPDSQAGIAYAKIRAVYHKYTKDMLAAASVDSLMRVPNVKSILGSTKRITEAQPESFYKKLQTYVDSKEKGTEKLDKNGDKIKNPKRVFECWPLIKVVKIYTKADALSTGAVIVDLPGVHDSNAARAAVAEGYMKQCTGLWIVAPITRAVDDKAAKSLLGDTFKRQLKYDGTYSAVTFICSKTDDISRTEATDSLQLGAEMGDIEDKLIELQRQRKALQKQFKAAKEKKQDQTDAVDTIEEQAEKWEELLAKVEDGKTVYAPSTSKSKKRKRRSESPVAKKKARRSADSDDEDEIISVHSDSEYTDKDEAENTSGPPLTKVDIESKLDEFKTLKKEARRERGELDEQIRDLRKQISKIEDEEAELDARQSELCIAGRNEYSRSAIQQDFAAGIKELDQETAEEEDPDNFNPEEDIRDYDEVARSLPVFCVSSRAYQKLSGRMQKDSDVPGFNDIAQTEIPSLQTHCKKLTENGRIASCRRFLNNLDQLLTSLGLWASDDGTGARLTDQQRDAEQRFLNRKLQDLEKALNAGVVDKLGDIANTLNDQLFDKFRPAIDEAASHAVPTATKWSSNRNEGGLHFMTYRATVRRSGVYQGASGFQDFNQQLFEPIQKQLASGWEKAFHRLLPRILQTYTRTATDLLQKFHSAIEARCREQGHVISRIGLLRSQMKSYEASFNDVIAAAVNQVNEGQKAINREFTPVITECMEPAYDTCANERGIGCYKRMKSHMTEHVDRNSRAMFDDACEQVRKRLSGLVEEVKTKLLEDIDKVYVNIRRDYKSIMGGGQNAQLVSISREERAVRNALDDLIATSDEPFQTILESDLENLQSSQASAGEDASGLGEGVEDDMDDGIISSEGTEAESGDEEDNEETEQEGGSGLEEEGAAHGDSTTDNEL